MWMNLAVGALSCPTTTMGSTNTDQRIAMLRDAIMQLSQYRDNQISKAPTRWRDTGGRPSLVLVAPEYMFVREGFQLALITDLKNNRFLESADRERVLAGLQRISAEFGKQLIFVPGSIASREKLPAPGADREERVKMAKQHIKVAAKAPLAFYPNLTKDQLMNFPTAAEMAGHKALTPNDKITKLKETLVKHKPAYYLAENVAYLFNNGKLLARYGKHGDYHERLPCASARTIFIPGIAPGRATVGGINFGIEICLDHGLGTLKNTPAVTSELSRVHILCSAEVDPDLKSVSVRDGGYFVHASSNPSYTKIQRKRGANWEPPANPSDGAVSGYPLRMGTIELDI